MSIDWFTVGAQLVNFIVLIALLRYFLFQPVLSAIDAREQRIADQLAQAAQTQAAASALQVQLDAKNAEFEAQREARMALVEQAASTEHERLRQLALTEAEALRQRQQRALMHDKARLQQQVEQRIIDEVFLIARQALADLAAVSLEERIAAVFIQRLSELDPSDHRSLATSTGSDQAVAVVRSAVELPDGQRTAIQRAVHQVLPTDYEVRFETAPALVSGIELTANGHKLGWSVAAYLDSLRSELVQLDANDTPTDPQASSHVQ